MSVELVGIEHRTIHRQHRDPLCTLLEGRTGAGRSRLRVALVLLLQEHLGPEPARLAGDRGVGRHNQDVVDAAASRQLEDQVEEEGFGEEES